MTSHKSIPLAGVIGDPVAHSRSPALFQHWFDLHETPGFYVPLHVTPDNLEQSLRALPRMGFVGANVTIPHKEQILHIADEVTEAARSIGAANTLTFGSDGTIHADNTDGYGFISNLTQSAPHWSAKSGAALVLGAGGAARAIVHALLQAGAPSVVIANRTEQRAKDLAADFGPRAKTIAWQAIPDLIPTAGTLVNTTSLGMVGQPPLTIDLSGLTTETLVTDIVYSPLKTDLLVQAESMGATTVDGLGMLLHQAVPGFERWFGTKPTVTEATRKAVLA